MSPATASEVKAAFLQLIEDRFGLRLSEHQARLFAQTVAPLAAQGGCDDPQALYDLLAAGGRPDLLEHLTAALTVGETHFYRVGPQIEALRLAILPDLIARRAHTRRLRLWSAGCSSGEEPYTLAILLRDAFPGLDGWDIQILATDVNRQALEVGQSATYGEWSFRDTPDQVRQRYFTQREKRWTLIEPLRRMVRFGYLNLAGDPFPSPGPFGPDLDLIVCRNVTIYLSPETTQRIYQRFADALPSDGWLVLGPSDPAPLAHVPFKATYAPGAVLWRPNRAVDRPAPAKPAVNGAGRRDISAPSRPPVPSGHAASRTLARSGGTPSSISNIPAPRLVRPDAAPAGPSADLERARVQLRGGSPGAACEILERLVRLQPLESGAHLLLGLSYLEQGAFEPARESLRRAAFLVPDHALAQFSLGRACLVLGDPGRARVALTHARRLLAALPDSQPLPDSDGLPAGELRRAVEALLESLRHGAAT